MAHVFQYLSLLECRGQKQRLSVAARMFPGACGWLFDDCRPHSCGYPTMILTCYNYIYIYTYILKYGYPV